MLFGVLSEVIVSARSHFCEIEGRVLFGLLFGGAVGGAGAQSLACFSLFGVYAGVFFISPLKGVPANGIRATAMAMSQAAERRVTWNVELKPTFTGSGQGLFLFTCLKLCVQCSPRKNKLTLECLCCVFCCCFKNFT